MAELDLILRYAPAPSRAALSALFALDAKFAEIVATTTEPVLGQMRLRWWHDALERLDTAPAPAEPLLRAVAAEVLALGLRGAELATLTGPWDAALAAEGGALAAAHVDRGERLFALLARLMRAEGAGVSAAGAAWALASAGLPAEEPLRRAASAAWPRRARPLLLPALAAADRRGAGAALRLAGFLLLGTRPLS